MTNFQSLIFYLTVYALSACFLWMSQKRKDNKKIDLWFIFAAALPILIAALRDSVGTDFDNYAWMYERQSQMSYAQWRWYDGQYADGTPFGMWLVSQIAGFFDSQEVFFGIAAALILVPVFLFIKNEMPKESSFLAAFIFLTGTFTTGFNMVKQGIAVAFIIYGMRYVFERKPVKFLLFVGIAYLFHPSAIIAAFIYFFWKKEGTKFSIKRFLLIALTVIFMLSLSTILESLGGRFAGYAEGTDVEFNNRTFYIDLFWCILFFMFAKKYTDVDSKNDTLIILFLVGLILSFSGFSSPYIKRIARYYTLSKFMLCAQLPLAFPGSEKRVIKLLVFAYTVVMFTISFYYLEQAHIIPYKFITRSEI